ncbi:MAG: hypothetical protein BMS9Abin25_0208 [Gammaproteobacteria bacterium]|nr:MAG: hypothetical protein BMS9Abin25_0208 [Gammaproteobacteria bacterium]
MSIRVAQSEVEIMDCFPVMQELGPNISKGAFLQRVQEQRSRVPHGQ